MLGRVNVILLPVLWLTDTKYCVILTVVIELQMLAGPATGGVPAGAPFFTPERMMQMPKPFLTYPQQLQKLKDKNLTIEDDAAAIITLHHYGYLH